MGTFGGRKLVLLATAALVSVLSGAQGTRAQTPFTSITVFGESYADRGNFSCFTTLGFANCPYPSHNPYPANPPSDATQIVPFSYKLQQLYGIPNSAAFDYAIAGSTAYSGQNGLSETAQVNSFVANGGHLGPSDLVAVQFIGNDGLNSAIVQNITHVPTAFDTGNPVTDAQNEAARDAANIQKLVNVGAQNIAFLSPGNLTLIPIGQTGLLGTAPFQASFNAYYKHGIYCASKRSQTLFAFGYSHLPVQSDGPGAAARYQSNDVWIPDFAKRVQAGWPAFHRSGIWIGRALHAEPDRRADDGDAARRCRAGNGRKLRG
jgi:hypothetical protein